MHRSDWLVPLLVLASLGGCARKQQAEAAPAAELALPPVKVQLGEVVHQAMPRYLTLTGTVNANRQAEVAANVSGKVIATYVERGQAVKQGQVLAAVDSKAAGLSASAAAAQSQAAEVQVNLAQQECQRAEALFETGAISQAEYERRKTQCKSQLFSANAARANADLAAKVVGDALIRAPFAGVVGERYVNVGEFVQPPSRVVSLFANDPVRVSISVPESAVGVVQEGQPVEVEVAAFPDRKFPAQVKYIGAALRPATRDLIVEAEAANPELALRPGMFATVRLEVGEQAQPTVPAEAIKAEGTVKRLFLARKGLAFEMVVRTGVSKEGRVVVDEPLAAGEQVILQPPPGLRDGSAIQ